MNLTHKIQLQGAKYRKIHRVTTTLYSAQYGKYWPGFLKDRLALILDPVIQTLDSAIYRINHYPADKY